MRRFHLAAARSNYSLQTLPGTRIQQIELLRGIEDNTFVAVWPVGVRGLFPREARPVTMHGAVLLMPGSHLGGGG